MSKKRVTHLRAALEMACEEIEHYRMELGKTPGDQGSDPEFWYQLACAHRQPLLSGQRHDKPNLP